MSVILFSPDKFRRIYETLRLRVDRAEYDPRALFEIEEDEDLDDALKRFCQKLHEVNVKAFNNRYNESEHFTQINFEARSCAPPYRDEVTLVKSLHSVKYNSIEAEEDHRMLQNVTQTLESMIVRKLPAYDGAEGWSD